MIDPISAFAALSAGHSAIMKGIQMGKDLSSLSGAVSRYAKGEAELQWGEARKKKSRFSIAEDSAIEKHFKKEKLDDMRAELRKAFLYFGKPGQWERLQAEIANERVLIKKRLQEEAERIERLILIWGTVITVVVGGGILFAWISFLKGTL